MMLFEYQYFRNAELVHYVYFMKFFVISLEIMDKFIIRII
jgi:hypothetical protein